MHNKIRKKMFFIKRRKLINDLFLTKPSYSQILMKIKDQVNNFDFEYIYGADSIKVDKEAEDISEFEIDKFFDQVDQNLDKVNQKFDTSFLPLIRSNLVDLCKSIKRKLQREGTGNKEDSKAKPLIHVEQEKHIRHIIRRFAQKDDHMLLNFLRLIQNMMRGMIFNN